MRKVVLDKKEYYITDTTPILCVVQSERSLTLAKLIVNGKEYIITINENGKAQMK